MTRLSLSILLLKVLKDVTYTQTVTAYLIRISRANALTRRTNLVLALLSLIGSIEHPVSRHDEMSLLGDMKTGMEIMAACLECLCLVHEEIGSQHHTIADDIHLATLEDTRGNRAQHILLTFELQRMAGIRTTLEACNHIVLRGQHIDHLTFSFITPLQSEQDVNFSFVHNNYLFSLTFLLILFILFLYFPHLRLAVAAYPIDIEGKPVLSESLQMHILYRHDNVWRSDFRHLATYRTDLMAMALLVITCFVFRTSLKTVTGNQS